MTVPAFTGNGVTDIAGRWYRVSSDGQDEANQHDTVESHIGAKGYISGPEYVAHDMSASKGEHLELLNQAIEDMRNGVINVLVVRHTDRIDRTESLADILKRVKAAGGRIESATEPWLADMSGLGGKVMTGVTEWMNAEYSRKLSVNVKNAHDRIRAEGYWTGSVPFGFRAQGAKGLKVLVHDPAEAAITTEAFTRIANGQSAASVAAWLDTVAPQTIKKTGKRSPWRARRVLQMVRNPVYKGEHATHTGYAPIVGPEVWASANSALLARSFETGGRRGTHGYSGVVFCPCGGVMYHHQTSRNGKPTGEAHYRCARGRRGIGSETKCGNPGIPFDAANAAIDAEMLADYRFEYVMQTTGGDAERQAQISALESKLAAANKRKDRKAAMALLGQIEELESMPATPLVTRPRKTGREIADVWEQGSIADRRAFLKGRVGVENLVLSLGPEGVKVWTDDSTAEEAALGA